MSAKIENYKMDCWRTYYNLLDPQHILTIDEKEIIKLTFFSGINAGIIFEPQGVNDNIVATRKG